MPGPSTELVSNALKFTAGVNFAVGVLAMAAPDIHVSLLFERSSPISGLMLRFHYIIWAFVAAMGVGYWIAARAPENELGLILAGALGKLAFAGLSVEMFISGHAKPLIFNAVLFDGLFGTLLLWFAVTRLRGATPRHEDPLEPEV